MKESLGSLKMGATVADHTTNVMINTSTVTSASKQLPAGINYFRFFLTTSTVLPLSGFGILGVYRLSRFCGYHPGGNVHEHK